LFQFRFSFISVVRTVLFDAVLHVVASDCCRDRLKAHWRWATLPVYSTYLWAASVYRSSRLSWSFCTNIIARLCGKRWQYVAKCSLFTSGNCYSGAGIILKVGGALPPKKKHFCRAPPLFWLYNYN